MEKLEINKELAEQEFENWREACDLDFDVQYLSNDQAALVANTKRRFIKAMAAGRLVIEDDVIIYTISEKSPEGFAGKVIKIQNPGAKLRLAMDGFKDNQQAEKEIAGMSAITGQDVGFFRKLYTTDFNLIEGIMALFILS